MTGLTRAQRRHERDDGDRTVPPCGVCGEARPAGWCRCDDPHGHEEQEAPAGLEPDDDGGEW